MKKTLHIAFNILFPVLNLFMSFCGAAYTVAQFFIPHERCLSNELAALVLLFATSSIYLLLMYKKLLVPGAYLSCFIGNLIMWGIPWVPATAFVIGSFISIPFLYFLLSASFVVQLVLVSSFFRKRKKQGNG